MSDQAITCSDCGGGFVFTEAEQAFYAERNLAAPPKRCKACRQARKTSGGQAGAGGYGAPRGRGRSDGPRAGGSGGYRGPSDGGGGWNRGGGAGGGERRDDRFAPPARDRFTPAARDRGDRPARPFGDAARGDRSAPARARPRWGDARPAFGGGNDRGPSFAGGGASGNTRPNGGDRRAPPRPHDGEHGGNRRDFGARPPRPFGANGETNGHAARDHGALGTNDAPTANGHDTNGADAAGHAAPVVARRASEAAPARFDITCSECGTQAQVPFKPLEGRQVFCQPCYRARRGTARPASDGAEGRGVAENDLGIVE